MQGLLFFVNLTRKPNNPEKNTVETGDAIVAVSKPTLAGREIQAIGSAMLARK